MTGAISSVAKTVSLLEQWGLWKRYGRPGPRLASGTRLMMQALAGSTVKEARITDEDACKVDHALAQLLQRNPDMGQVVELYFSTSMSIREVATALRLPRTRTEQLRNEGVAWIDGWIG